MWRFLLIFLAFFCCAPAAFPPGKILMPLNVEGLSSAQLNLVEEAEQSWARQTNGCVQFIETPVGVPVLPMIPVTKYDEPEVEKTGHYVLGHTTRPFGPIEIAFGRLQQPGSVVLVTMHELGHIIGLEHVTGNPHALMNWDVSQSILQLSAEDRAELYRVTGCR